MIKIKTMCTRLCCVCALRLCSVLCVALVCCSLLHRCCSVLCILYSVLIYMFASVLLCICVSCICVLCVCMCAYCVCIVCAYLVCMCVRELPVEVSTQSDTPHVGYLCGYMVRIIKYKKTQPLIKLKSI